MSDLELQQIESNILKIWPNTFFFSILVWFLYDIPQVNYINALHIICSIDIIPVVSRCKYKGTFLIEKLMIKQQQPI